MQLCRWDTDDINKWEIPAFKREDNTGGTFTEESTFTILFPKYREVYLREAVSRNTLAHNLKNATLTARSHSGPSSHEPSKSMALHARSIWLRV